MTMAVDLGRKATKPTNQHVSLCYMNIYEGWMFTKNRFVNFRYSILTITHTHTNARKPLSRTHTRARTPHARARVTIAKNQLTNLLTS